MKRRIFRRAFILYVAVFFISISFINYYLTAVLSRSYIDNLKDSLSSQAAIISDLLPLFPRSYVVSFCRGVKEKVPSRVTIIEMTGKVLCDSHRDVSKMDNHGNRPEIQEAIVLHTGSSVRFSNTLQYEMLYIATTFMEKGKHKGFIRLAVPLTEVHDSIRSLRLKITLAVTFVFLVFGLILIRQTERMRKYVTQIADYVDALSHGFLKKKLYLGGAGEFTDLSHNLNNMASELEESFRARDEETNRLNVILRSIPDALLFINVQGSIELSNNAARELFSSDQLDGRPFIEVVRSPGFLALIDEVKQSRTPGSVEITIDTPEEKYLSVRVSPLFYKVGELAGFVVIFHDTTQMRKLEQMRKDFVANVSHEIKTPITAINGFAETLLDGALHDTENAEKFLNTIKAHSQRLNRLVEDLLIISRIELGVIKINKKEINISDLIDSVMQTTVIQAATKNIHVRKANESEDVTMTADRDRVEQILLNLLDNAIKFTESGDIIIGVSREDLRKYLFVKDSGIGIEEKHLSRLGERFFRVDPSRSRELGGTGLGLAIVKHLVKAHGWEMKIESELDKGTTVKIYYS